MKKIRAVLGEFIGDVEEVETDNDQDAWGRYLKVRVSLNVSKPLKRGKMIPVAGGGKTLATFRYERLSDICYVCGRMDHQDQNVTRWFV